MGVMVTLWSYVWRPCQQTATNSVISTIITNVKSTTGLNACYTSALLVHKKSVYPLWLIQKDEGEEKETMFDKGRASNDSGCYCSCLRL